MAVASRVTPLKSARRSGLPPRLRVLRSALFLGGALVAGCAQIITETSDASPATSRSSISTTGLEASESENATTIPTSSDSDANVSSSTTLTAPAITAASTTLTTSVPLDDAPVGTAADAGEVVGLRIESRVPDFTTAELRGEVLEILNDERGWIRAGFTFVSDDDSPFRLILAEGPEIDQLCLPLVTYGSVSCQNGPVVALNATRWRVAVEHWDAEVADYRGYLVNHEVGHLIGQRHPTPRCVIVGRPAGVMEQQTAGLEGCTGNAWPREWEIELAALRPVVYAPLPDWGPDPVPTNGEQ